MHNTKLLLEVLTREMPPKKGQHHNITLDGTKLQVSLMLPKGAMKFYIEGEDMDVPIEDLMHELLLAAGLSECL